LRSSSEAVITGLGVVSPIGIGVEAFWESACLGRSGLGRPSFPVPALPDAYQVVGEVRDFLPRQWISPQTARTASRFSQFAVAAADMACLDAGIPRGPDRPRPFAPEALKVAIGTSMDGQADVGETSHTAFIHGEPLKSFTVLEYPAHASSSHVAIAMGAAGQAMTFATACAAGLDAIAWASDEVRSRRAQAVLAGGSESPLSAYGLGLFHSVGVLSRWDGDPKGASRPFDRLRSGLVLAEGAAVVLVEDRESALRRGATPYARVLGYATANEALHLRKVDMRGLTVARAIEAALRRARLAPGDIDYICAHGNSMPDYDTAETAGIKHALGRHAWNVPVSSIKSMCGQALAASSAMQVVTACLTLRRGVIHPTANYEYPDPACDLDYVPRRARRARVRTVLIHAHSLGGAHVALILGKESSPC
jgi:3-oxoacyl-[acyl-carrier-protein] synthase II